MSVNGRVLVSLCCGRVWEHYECWKCAASCCLISIAPSSGITAQYHLSADRGERQSAHSQVYSANLCRFYYKRYETLFTNDILPVVCPVWRTVSPCLLLALHLFSVGTFGSLFWLPVTAAKLTCVNCLPKTLSAWLPSLYL